jgi:hypothetical protein
MGNMGFPVITRLGINQFWYNHWVNDFSYKYNSKVVRVALDSIYMYFKFGVTLINSLNVSSYWFPKSVKTKAISKIKADKNLYFRRKFVINERFSVNVSWDFNKTVGEYFPMRTWFMRYSNWTVIFTFWFKPIKNTSKNIVSDPIPNARRSVRFSNFNISTYLTKRALIVSNLISNKYVF